MGILNNLMNEFRKKILTLPPLNSIVKENQLILGPFQGPVACFRIEKGNGVCGMAWKLNKTVIVPDVEKFPGHIACSSDSKSEMSFNDFSRPI